MKYNWNIILFSIKASLIIMLFTTCKKEVGKDDYENSNGNLFTVFSIDSLRGVTPFAIFNRPNGGLLLFYQPGKSTSYVNGMVVIATDENGNTINANSLGGSGLTYFWGAQQDDYGNIYLIGNTNSLEIRKDIWVDSPDVDKTAAYLAKVNPNGNIVWETGFSDSTSPAKGEFFETFWGLEIVNNKPVCLAPGSENLQSDNNYGTPTGPLLVSFDENGNVLKKFFFPPIFKGDYDHTIGTNYGICNDLIKVSDNELIMRNTYVVTAIVGGDVPDTTAYVCRYNILNDQITWERYFDRNSKQGDLYYCGRLGSDRVAFFDVFYNTLNVLDATSGNIISTKTIHNYSFAANELQYNNNIPYMRNTIDGDLYFIGSAGLGSITLAGKPFVIKVKSDGMIEYEKLLDIQGAGVYSMIKNKNGYLQFLGSVSIFNSQKTKLFTICTDKYLNPVSK